MKSETDPTLLNDVFGDAAPADLREAMLGESLRQVRRRRTSRLLSRVAGACLLSITIIFLVRRAKVPPSFVTANSVPVIAHKAYTLVHTHPFAALATITTKPFQLNQTAETMAFHLISTTPNNYRSITDEELLLRFSSRPCALVQIGPNQEKLVFLSPMETNGFPLN